MKEIHPIMFVLLTVALLSFSCAEKKYVPWEAVPEKGENVTFDKTRGVLIKKKSRIILSFTPIPYLKKVDDNSFQGTIALMNNSKDDATVLWETVNLSDSFGFFKTFRFGQKKNLSAVFPDENVIIPSGNERIFSFTLNRSDYDKAIELSEHAIFTLILPIKYLSTSDTLTLEVPYSIREME